LTASGIFWKEDEVRKRGGVGVVQRISLHTIQTPHHHLIYMGIQGEEGGIGRRRQVEKVEFLLKRDKWIGWNSLQEETSGRDTIFLNIVLLCANCRCWNRLASCEMGGR
jgi:hypothetical protein